MSLEYLDDNVIGTLVIGWQIAIIEFRTVGFLHASAGAQTDYYHRDDNACHAARYDHR